MTGPSTGLPAAVLWDMDGTLVDSEKLWTVALHELMTEWGGQLTDEVRASLVGSNMERTLAIMLAEAGRPADPATFTDGERCLLDRMAELFRGNLPWQPGAREALRAIRDTGLPTALVTSTERELTEIALDTIGRDFFDVTVCGDEVAGQNKPHPRPYQRAAELLRVDPAACVAIEDSPTGATSAERAGCLVLVVPSEVEVPAGERRVLRDSLIGLDAELLAELRRPWAA